MKGNKLFYRLLLLIFTFLAESLYANGKINIVATLPDLKYIVEQVGGARVEVAAIAKGYQDPHFVDAKPSFVLKLKDADLFVQVGLDLEVGWVPPLLETARNNKIYFGGKGFVNASQGVPLLEIPLGDPAQLRAQGDIHIFGNPHYWLDPENGKVIARNICEKLITIKPEFAAEFQKNLQRFSAQIDSAVAVWQARLAPYQGAKIIAYHNSWPYFAHRFGIELAGFIEPKPGIPPSPAHLVSIINTMQKQNIKVLIIEPYFDDKPARSVAERTGAVVVHIAPMVGAAKEIKTYFDLFDYNINALVEAFQKQKVSEHLSK
jgi:ABC-type Zn uptake system ZnuABC Zn-binding protein ZnuA